MATTTPSGRTRLPTLGDTPDVPADLMNLAVDLEGLIDNNRPDKWFKSGRVDRTIEGNGYLRILSSECFFNGVAPKMVLLNGIDDWFVGTWDGLFDGSGVLCKVYTLASGSRYGAGATVAINFIAVRS